MSTRSLIAMEVKPRKGESQPSFKYVYSHWDGHPMTNGIILSKHYRNRRKVVTLLNLGDISSLGRNIGKKHPFDDPPRPADMDYNEWRKQLDKLPYRRYGWTKFYGRDRGEKLVNAKNASNLRVLLEAAREYCTEYVYVYTLDGNWRFSPVPIKDGVLAFQDIVFENICEDMFHNFREDSWRYYVKYIAEQLQVSPDRLEKQLALCPPENTCSPTH